MRVPEVLGFVRYRQGQEAVRDTRVRVMARLTVAMLIATRRRMLWKTGSTIKQHQQQCNNDTRSKWKAVKMELGTMDRGTETTGM